MKLQLVYKAMIFSAVAYFGRECTAMMAKGHKLMASYAFVRGHQHSTCFAQTFAALPAAVRFSLMDLTASNRLRCNEFRSYQSLGRHRAFAAAASGSSDGDTPIRRAKDYDNDLFAPVPTRDSASSSSKTISDKSYGFFDSLDDAFDHLQDDASNPEPMYDDDVAAFRARYQRPKLSDSRNERPQITADYNEDDGSEEVHQQNYNWFEDGPQSSSKEPSNPDHLDGGRIVRSSARIIQPNQQSSYVQKSAKIDNMEGGRIVRTSAKILQPGVQAKGAGETEPKVVNTTARILPKKANDSQCGRQPLPKRNYVPSFMEPEKTKVATHKHDVNGERLTPNMSQASSGTSSISYSTTLLHQIEHLTSQIYQLNNGEEFNIDSPKQVSRVLFGEEGRSANKDALEALASTGNQLAASIYKYRKLTREYKRELKKIEQIEKGGKKNDYYGNLARHRDADAESISTRDKLEGSNTRREPLLLIDTSAYIFRSYHAVPPLHHSDGTPTGALHGVCRMLQNLLLNRLLKGDQPRVVLVFDSKGDNFRHELYPEYKANRGPCPEDLIPQFDLVREAADAFGIVQVQAEGYEADDVIATLAKRAVEEGVDVDILSGDKDLMQLITPSEQIPSVHMIDPMHFDRVSHDDVMKKWGVSSEKLGDVLALAGDSSDNIPGAPGIGPKIAASLIEEYGSLDVLIEQASNIKQKKRKESLIENADNIRLYRKLVTLDETIPSDKMTLPFAFESVSNFRMSEFDPNK
ncbi:hypothetical protein ACHAWO_003552 [Cyclotella atomus]|uniref:5'-3' exonuclease domain-containing protein n=1 Tax=Cyclotella atomus TaxID=382360 RepID=A0ABD3QXY1_9STRA